MSISSVDSSILHVKPIVDLNIAAEADRILYVLNKIISRAKFVGLLERFIKEKGGILKSILDANTYYIIHETCEKYLYPPLDKSGFSGSSMTLSNGSAGSLTKTSEKFLGRADDVYGDDQDDASDDIEEDTSRSSSSKSGFSDAKNSARTDILLSKVLYLLEDHPEIQALFKTMEDELSPQMKFFVKYLKEFRDRMAIQLNENSTQFKNKEKYLRETYEKNLKSKREIERLEEELVVTKTDANVCLIGRHILINRHQNKIEKIQKNSAETIEKRVHESEKAMVNDWKESLVQQERLKQDYTMASEKYANMLKDHMAAEKILRTKRAKIENQVLGWIQKFDQEIGEKQAEEEEIQALLDKELNEVNELQRKLEEQEEEYDDLMQEKAEYEEAMLDKRLYQFVVNRSARNIQRCFRMYKAKKLAKKMSKKGKKGKKAN